MATVKFNTDVAEAYLMESAIDADDPRSYYFTGNMEIIDEKWFILEFAVRNRGVEEPNIQVEFIVKKDGTIVSN